MAMSETPSKPIDWAQYYHLSPPPPPPPPPSAAAESIVVTTTATATAQSAHPGAGGSYAQIEGRVGKSGRRRSRASRRAPTTLLNTDTTNFRAMVQQFTGVPTVPFSSNNTTYQPSAAPAGGMGFGYGAQHRRGQPVVAPTQPDYYPGRHHHLQQQQQQRQGDQGAMFSLSHGNETFHPVFTNPRPTSDFSEDFLEILSSSSAPQIPPRENNNNSSSSHHGYIL